MNTKIYNFTKEVDWLIPEAEQFDDVHNSYVALATEGKADKKNSEILISASRTLIDRGAEAIVLGGTDLFLVFFDVFRILCFSFPLFVCMARAGSPGGGARQRPRREARRRRSGHPGLQHPQHAGRKRRPKAYRSSAWRAAGAAPPASVDPARRAPQHPLTRAHARLHAARAERARGSAGCAPFRTR